MAKFNSFSQPLIDVMNYIAEQTPSPMVVEYGPGYSTKLMCKLVPDVKVFTTEHNQKWYKSNAEKFIRAGFNNVKLVYKKKRDGYVQAPLSQITYGSVDLVYVDGRRRVSCLKLAEKLIKPGQGIIMLHDAERFWYKTGYSDWAQSLRIWAGERGDRTLILTSSRDQYHALRHLETSPPAEPVGQMIRTLLLKDTN